MVENGQVVPQRAGTREWVGLGVISIACVLYVMDLTVLHLAVPAISKDLRPSSTQLLWIIDVYGFMVAGSLITMGTLGDRIGRRRLLMIGAAAFGATSILAAFSRNAEMLIATRALLGLAGATIAPSTLSLIRNMFLDRRQRTVAIGIWITAFSAGSAIGPLLGGAVLEFFWWGAVFLLAVPVMALLLVLAPRFLPEYRDPACGRLDIASAVLSLLAVLSVIFGLKQFAQDGFGWVPVASMLAGAALAVVFVRRQRRLEDPLIDLRLFRTREFTAALATYGFGIFLAFGGYLFLPQFLQLVRGLTPLEAGLWTLPWALAFVVGSNITPPIARRLSHAAIMSVGLLIASVGFVMFTQIDSSTGFWYIGAASIVLALGAAPLFTLTNDLIIGSAPPERAGAAAGLSETAAEFGGALGIAIFGSIGVALYRSGIRDALPSGLSAEAVATAKDTLGGAFDVAATLPGRTGTALLDAAREAFTRGLHFATAVSAAGAVLLAAFVYAMLRRVEPATEEDVARAPEPGVPPVAAVTGSTEGD